ncbi:cytochrome c [Xylophilus sp. GOD-11R]|uniref:c-type cytochrome n=1 Tax=Xylophilus sp. GOD-11R TaxID=3089814 RepID=UPI00298D23D4|nr:cytochrome c [Xylophilus sp. GOD-11R]WPB58746.1 cytochrome c [Xylophilus sp. GOD-11R]
MSARTPLSATPLLAVAMAALLATGARAQTPVPTTGGATSGERVSAPRAPVSKDPQVLRGQYLAQAGDCISCHTRPQGAPFAGGLPMQTPFGTIVSTNITPDPDQGIGAYTVEDFGRALRKGRARDGHYLYPAMPYTNFARLSDEDVASLYAYFKQGVAPARQDNPETALKWPYRMRWLMAGWNLLYLDGAPYAADSAQSAEWNRGAYLVQGLGHCSACHTPRGFTGAEKAASEKGGDVFLSGALVDGWYAQPLRASALPGLATWSRDDIVDYLRTGRNPHTAAFGPMAEVVANSTQHMSREDLAAMASYLQAIPPAKGASATAPAAPAPDATAAALHDGQVPERGAMVYLNNCAACHRSDGQGAARTFPALARSSAVAAADPTSLIRIVLRGSAMPHTTDSPAALAMPGFGWRLQDADVADLLSFVRKSWGNAAGAVQPAQVATVRASLPK